MNGRRDAESTREPDRPAARPLLQTSWFRAAVIFGLVGVLALLTVPWTLRLAARGAGDRTPAAHPGSATSERIEVAARDDPMPAGAGALVVPVSAAVAPGAPAALAGSADTARPGARGQGGPRLAQAQTPAPKTGESKPEATPKTSEAKPETAPKASGARPEAATRPAAAKSASGPGAPYWVQVGAFRDPQAARRVAQQLRDANFRVQESTVTRPAAGGSPPLVATPGRGAPAAPAVDRPAAPDRYEVLVIGAASELEPKLGAKGLATRAAPDGLVITPTLMLNEAVELSKQLTADGLTVRVRRVGATAAGEGSRPATGSAPAAGAPTAGAAAATGEGETLYRVRVGEFPDRAAAMAALQQLEARGFKPFLARGGGQ